METVGIMDLQENDTAVNLSYRIKNIVFLRGHKIWIHAVCMYVTYCFMLVSSSFSSYLENIWFKSYIKSGW